MSRAVPTPDCWFVKAVVHDTAAPYHEMLVDAARAMRRTAWWRSIPVYSEPAPVSGEFDAR